MSLQDKISVDISAINPITKEYNYGFVTLPAISFEIENAFQKARVLKGGEYTIEIISSPKVPKLGEVRIDGGMNIVELNLLAKKIDLLSDDQLTVFNAMFENSIDDEGMAPSLEELINMTDGLDNVPFVRGITTDEQLGEFVLDNNLSEVLQTASYEVKEYISHELVGQKFREMENGVFYNGAYILLGAYEKQFGYKSPPKELLEVKNDIAFGIEFAREPAHDDEDLSETAEWIYLPIDKKYANEIASMHGETCIENGVYYDFKSAFPSIDGELFDDMQKFDTLNEIAERYVKLDAANRIKFKAVVEKVVPQTLDEVLEISDNLSRYEHSYYTLDEGEFGKEYLSMNLPTNFAMDVFANVELKYVGDRILERIGADINDYGAVSDIDRSLYDTVTSSEPGQEEIYEQEEFEEQEEGIGGMTM